jgi:hypothetical protein
MEFFILKRRDLPQDLGDIEAFGFPFCGSSL